MLWTLQGFQMFTGITGAKRRKMSERLEPPKLYTVGSSLARGYSHVPNRRVISKGPSKNANLTSLSLLCGVGPGHR